METVSLVVKVGLMKRRSESMYFRGLQVVGPSILRLSCGLTCPVCREGWPPGLFCISLDSAGIFGDNIKYSRDYP
jgi:hypothetical protein